MTLLNCLAAAIPARERVVTCEEVFELQIPLPDVVAMQTRQANLEGTGEIQLRRLVKEALRMRPDRIIIVGEVRQEECLDLLISLNSRLAGHVLDPRQFGARGDPEAVHAAAAGRCKRRARLRMAAPTCASGGRCWRWRQRRCCRVRSAMRAVRSVVLLRRTVRPRSSVRRLI